MRLFHLVTILTFILIAPSMNAQAPPTIRQELTKAGVGTSREELITALRSANGAIRGMAAAQLADNKDAGAVPDILDALKTEREPLERLNLATALDTLGESAGLSTLIELCNNDGVRSDLRVNAATRTLGRQSSECLRPMVYLLNTEKNPAVQLGALYFLLDQRLAVGPDANQHMTPGLHLALQSPVAMVRQKAAECVRRFHVSDERADLDAAIRSETDAQAKSAMELALSSFHS